MNQRYLVRRATGEVWIWTDALTAAFPDLEDVYATSAEEAKIKKAMPDPRTMSLEHLESMSKGDLMLFAKVRMGLELDPALSKGDMCDTIKENIFMRSAEGPATGMVAGDAGAKATILRPPGAANPAEVEAESQRRIREAMAEADKAEAAALARIAAAKKAAAEAEKLAQGAAGGRAKLSDEVSGGPIGGAMVDTGGPDASPGADQPRGP